MKARIRIARRPVLIGFLSAILAGQFVPARNAVANADYNTGFRELAWGVSVEQASKIYPDLQFGSYVIVDGKEEPSRLFYRTRESGRLDGVNFESIEYWFKRDRLYKVRAVLHSRIGPRTLVTRAEDAYDRMVTRLNGIYGESTREKVEYAGQLVIVVKEKTWDAGSFAITLGYEGPKDTNEDLMTYEIRKK